MPERKRVWTYINWPLCCLLLGLGMVGGCCWCVGHVADGLIPAGLRAGDVTNEPSVGVLSIEGEINASIWATDALDAFARDDDVKSLVVRVDSPGGDVAPCQEIYHALRDFGKPVVVSMGSTAASGGLYIAMAGDTVVANPGALTGSIGVIMESLEASGALDKLGLKSQVVKSGEFKDIGSMYRPMQESERELLHGMIMEVYGQFVADVAAGRPNLGEADVRKFADGRVFSGAEAKRLGLVDELGGFEDAVKIAAKLGGLPEGERPNLVIEDGSLHWWETMAQSKAPLALPASLQPGAGLKFLYKPAL